MNSAKNLLLIFSLASLMAPICYGQEFTTVEFSKTAELDPFDPSAVWIGTGTTETGAEVGIRAFGLAISPGDGFTNVDAFTFQVTRNENLIASLDMNGTFTPTGDLTGTTGDILLTGTQNSTLMSSTVNGLVTTMGSVSFVPIPEPTTQFLTLIGSGIAMTIYRRRFRRTQKCQAAENMG